MVLVHYPEVERLIEVNKEILTKYPQKKGDRHRVSKKAALILLLDEVKQKEGNIYTKGALLLVKIVRAHAFDSGNKRTAFFTTREFIQDNHEVFRVSDDEESNTKVMVGVREGFYSLEDITNWLENGDIREFKRSI